MPRYPGLPTRYLWGYRLGLRSALLTAMRWTTTIAGVAREFDVTDEQIEIAKMAIEDYGHTPVGPAAAAVKHVTGLTLAESVAVIQCTRRFVGPS